MKRFIFDLILFLAVFILPWWVSLFLVFIGIFIFDNFYEFILTGTMLFALYRPGSDRLLASPIIFFASIIILYLIIQLVRDNIILYKK